MKITVLHLIECLTIGGAERRLYNDLKYLDKERFRNIVCYMSGKGEFSNEFLELDARPYFLNASGLFDIRGFVRLMQIAKTNCVDIIHSQLFMADIYGRLVGKICGIPAIISTVQSSAHEPQNSYLYSTKRRLVDGITGRLYTTQFIAVSEFVKQSLINRLGIDEKKITVIPNYVDVDAFCQVSQDGVRDLRSKLGLKDVHCVLIIVGRLDPPKGHSVVIEALHRVCLKKKPVKLLILGDGPYRTHLENICSTLGLNDHVLFLGVRKDVKELLHLSDIFVFPTFSEGMSVALLEAMAVGLPCIASDIGPNREAITHQKTGLLFTPGKTDELESCILSLMHDHKKCRRLGMAARESVQLKFAPQQNVSSLEELYLRTYYQRRY